MRNNISLLRNSFTKSTEMSRHTVYSTFHKVIGNSQVNVQIVRDTMNGVAYEESMGMLRVMDNPYTTAMSLLLPCCSDTRTAGSETLGEHIERYGKTELLDNSVSPIEEDAIVFMSEDEAIELLCEFMPKKMGELSGMRGRRTRSIINKI